MNKRRYRRMEVVNFSVDVSDGKGFFSGQVTDLSRFGLQLNDIPKRLNHKASKLSVVVSGNGKNFKMQAIPKWACENGHHKIVGIELVNVPSSWSQFVMGVEPGDVDVWGTRDN